MRVKLCRINRTKNFKKNFRLKNPLTKVKFQKIATPKSSPFVVSIKIYTKSFRNENF